MAIQKANSVWRRMHFVLKTNADLVGDAMKDPKKFKQLMQRYRASSLDYLDWLMIQDKKVLSATDRRLAARDIWDNVLAMMPEQLTSEWSKGDVAFRDVLCEAVHLCWHESQYVGPYVPAIDGLASPVPGADEERLRLDREIVLARARERLRESKENVNDRLYIAFVIWESDMRASRHSLSHKIQSLPGWKYINELLYKKRLSEARDVFGRYLTEEVGNLFAEKDDLGVEKFREAFERLDLMDDYALNSGYCRCVLELPE